MPVPKAVSVLSVFTQQIIEPVGCRIRRNFLSFTARSFRALQISPPTNFPNLYCRTMCCSRRMRFRSLILIITLVLVNQELSKAASHSIRISPEAIQGCYEVGKLEWHPKFEGDDAVFITPPERIQLLAERGTQGFEKDQYLVRPAPGFPKSIHRYSYWRPKRPHSLEIVWSTGLSGLRMSLKVDRDTLKGKARTFWDFPSWGAPSARVLAHKVDCSSSESTR